MPVSLESLARERGFSGREWDVARAILARPERPYKQVADELHISERTVKFHAAAILRKLGHPAGSGMRARKALLARCGFPR